MSKEELKELRKELDKAEKELLRNIRWKLLWIID